MPCRGDYNHAVARRERGPDGVSGRMLGAHPDH